MFLMRFALAALAVILVAKPVLTGDSLHCAHRQPIRREIQQEFFRLFPLRTIKHARPNGGEEFRLRGGAQSQGNEEEGDVHQLLQKSVALKSMMDQLMDQVGKLNRSRASTGPTQQGSNASVQEMVQEPLPQVGDMRLRAAESAEYVQKEVVPLFVEAAKEIVKERPPHAASWLAMWFMSRWLDPKEQAQAEAFLDNMTRAKKTSKRADKLSLPVALPDEPEEAPGGKYERDSRLGSGAPLVERGPGNRVFVPFEKMGALLRQGGAEEEFVQQLEARYVRRNVAGRKEMSDGSIASADGASVGTETPRASKLKRGFLNGESRGEAEGEPALTAAEAGAEKTSRVGEEWEDEDDGEDEEEEGGVEPSVREEERVQMMAELRRRREELEAMLREGEREEEEEKRAAARRQQEASKAQMETQQLTMETGAEEGPVAMPLGGRPGRDAGGEGAEDCEGENRSVSKGKARSGLDEAGLVRSGTGGEDRVTTGQQRAAGQEEMGSETAEGDKAMEELKQIQDLTQSLEQLADDLEAGKIDIPGNRSSVSAKRSKSSRPTETPKPKTEPTGPRAPSKHWEVEEDKSAAECKRKASGGEGLSGGERGGHGGVGKEVDEAEAAKIRVRAAEEANQEVSPEELAAFEREFGITKGYLELKQKRREPSDGGEAAKGRGQNGTRKDSDVTAATDARAQTHEQSAKASTKTEKSSAGETGLHGVAGGAGAASSEKAAIVEGIRKVYGEGPAVNDEIDDAELDAAFKELEKSLTALGKPKPS